MCGQTGKPARQIRTEHEILRLTRAKENRIRRFLFFDVSERLAISSLQKTSKRGCRKTEVFEQLP